MKKILFTSILVLITFVLFAQGKKKTEYRYGAFKASLINSWSSPPAANPDVLIKAPVGDLIKAQGRYSNYTPGVALSFVYNLDAKNDKWGIVFGLEAQNNGFQASYKSQVKEDNIRAVDRYRVMAVGVPVYFKFGRNNIYRYQSYGFVGLQYNYYIYVQNIHTGSWTSQRYSKLLTDAEKRNGGIALLFGYNHNIYSIQLEYWLTNYVDKGYSVIANEGVAVNPYAHVSYKNNIFLKVSTNIPMTRWLTAKNWRAEQIRRALKRN